MSSKVYIIQRPTYRDRATGNWVSRYDLSPAEEFGFLVDVLPVGEYYPDPVALVEALETGLEIFDVRTDYLLAVGDPVAIGAATLIAGRESGFVSILKWDRRDQRYHPFEIRLREG